ncbi:hypothetical protein EMIT043CA1_40194 [Pseudomonas brassicacearum]
MQQDVTGWGRMVVPGLLEGLRQSGKLRLFHAPRACDEAPERAQCRIGRKLPNVLTLIFYSDLRS